MDEMVLTSLNWLDLAMIIVIIVSLYLGAVKGFVVEIFKVLGLFLATVLSLHFYVRSSEFLNQLMMMPRKAGEIASYFIIVVFVVLLFRVVREGWLLILKVEAKAGISQWMGFATAFLNAAMMCGLLFFGILLFGHQTLHQFAEKSVTGFYFRELSPKIYRKTYEGLIVPFFPDEPMNPKVFMTISKEPDR